MSEKSSSYKTSNFVASDKSPSYLTARREPSPGERFHSNFFYQIEYFPNEILQFSDVVDHSSNIKVSTLKNGARRDSWDVINKTKHLLSHNSLESLANMTENQLNTDLSYNRPQELENETERNTRYNKFQLAEKQRLEARRNSEEAAKYRLLS